MTDQDMRAIVVIAVDIDDAGWPSWAGVIPIHTSFGHPIPDPHVPEGKAPPAAVTSYLNRKLLSNQK